MNLSPVCPGCGAPPLEITPTQWFCTNTKDCSVIIWHPQLSLEANMADSSTIDLSALDDDPKKETP